MSGCAVLCCAVLCCGAGEVKAELITLLTDIVARHQKARAQVTDDIVDAFMAVRPMNCLN
jgi:tryptophanyl-tRNA synthetase